MITSHTPLARGCKTELGDEDDEARRQIPQAHFFCNEKAPCIRIVTINGGNIGYMRVAWPICDQIVTRVELEKFSINLGQPHRHYGAINNYQGLKKRDTMPTWRCDEDTVQNFWGEPTSPKGATSMHPPRI